MTGAFDIERMVHELFAKVNGYFWLPCPICGEYFGGHEWTDPRATIWQADGSGSGVCAGCIPEAVKRSVVRFSCAPWP